MSDLGPKCEHECGAGHRAIKPAQIVGAIDNSERGRKRARAAMSPETRRIWDELSESVAEFKRSRLNHE